MTGIKLLAGTCFVAATDATLDLPLGAGEKFGIIAILLIATIALWRDAGKRQDKLEGLIKDNTTVTALVIKAIEKCGGKQ